MNFDTLDMARLRGLAGNKWQRYGDEILPAWVADMDFLQAAPIRDYVAHAGATGDLGYPFAQGPEPLPAIFAERAMQRYGWRVDTERVELIIDVVQGLYLGLDIYCKPGESAIVPTPVYPYFLTAAEDNKRRAIANALVSDGTRFVIDFDALEACIDDRTRVLMVCNPHNPTGRVFLRDELEALAQVALRHDLVVIADEIFADVVYQGHRYIPFASLGPEIAARTVTFHSATKAFNLGGIRLAVAVFGSEALHERFKAVPARLLGGHNCLGINLTRIAWQQCDDWLAGVVPYLEANRDFVSEFLARLERHLESLGLHLARTRVGDRYVVEHMRAHGYNLGGEQSGHIILADHATTGDGLLAALQALAVLAEDEAPASTAARSFTPLPQTLESVACAGAEVLESSAVAGAVRAAESLLAGNGRLLVRMSGTEPKARVMAEGEDAAVVARVIDDIAAALASDADRTHP